MCEFVCVSLCAGVQRAKRISNTRERTVRKHRRNTIFETLRTRENVISPFRLNVVLNTALVSSSSSSSFSVLLSRRFRILASDDESSFLLCFLLHLLHVVDLLLRIVLQLRQHPSWLYRKIRYEFSKLIGRWITHRHLNTTHHVLNLCVPVLVCE